ncbi:MAG: ATP-binding protein [Thermoplasmatota archaeon]
MDRKEIKTITGIRRCGKSTLIYQIIDGLLTDGIAGNDIILINFDDDMLSGKPLSDIMSVYLSRIGMSEKINIFLDEVHRCPDWVGYLRKKFDLRRVGQVVITDSSSKFIKGEYTTLLTGRTIDIKLNTLSFIEFSKWNGMNTEVPLSQNDMDRSRHMLERYLRWGGFPEVALAESDIQKKILLKSYIDSILYKDVVERYDANIHKLKILVDYILSTPAAKFSPRKFSRNHDISLETLNNYIRYLREVNLIHVVPRFDYSLNKVMRSTKKLYIEDTGLLENLGFRFMEGMGKLYENSVCNELLRREFEVYYWSDDRSECDFIAKKGKDLVMAIQVCYDLNTDNIKREIEGLGNACSRLEIDKGMIISSRVPDLDLENFEVVPLWQFLFNYNITD